MFTGNYLKKLLFGSTNEIKKVPFGRVTVINFPPTEGGDVYREIKYPSGDGLILHFLKRIEKLEKVISELQSDNLKGKCLKK